MKRKITATLYTLFFGFTVFASPVFLEWYLVDFLHRSNDFVDIPFGVAMFVLMMFVAQSGLSVYLWARVFDEDLK